MANVDEDILRNEPNLQTSHDVEEYIQILSAHQLACEKSAKYMEADAAKSRIAELKKQLIWKKKKEMQQAHSEYKSEMEKSHIEEFNQFNAFWDNKMQKFTEEANQVEQELVGRQECEYRQIAEQLEKTIPIKAKESSEILNLKKIEEHLAKQKNYVEAHQIQAKRSILEKEENNSYQQNRQQKIKTQLTQLQQRHQNELNVLQQRIRAGMDELRKNRSIDLERLLQKYQNVKNEIQLQQQMDLLSFDGQFKSKGTGNQSIYKSVMSKGKQQQQQLQQQ